MTTPSIVIKARKPGEPGMATELRELWQYRTLIRSLVTRELKIRYKNSVLGIFWSMVSPLVQVFVMTIAVSYFMHSGRPNQSAFIFCAYLPWTFFQNAVLDGSTAILTQFNLLKKVYFPREIPLISAVMANFVHLLMALGVFVVYRWLLLPIILGFPGTPHWTSAPPAEILLLPVLLLIQVILTLGVAFFVCAWNVFYEDVKFVVTMMFQFLFYFLPILYSAEDVMYSSRMNNTHVRWWAYHLYLCNPLAWLVTAYKQVFLGIQPMSNHGNLMSAPFDYRYMLITAATSCILCITGYSYFNQKKWKFTERP